MSRPPVFKRSISQHEVAQFIDSPDEVFVDEETHQRILNHPASNGENLRAQWALVHLPDRTSSMASLHPAGALFDKSYSFSKCYESHMALQNALKQHDVVTVVLRDVLRLCSKEELVSLACECVSYELEQGTSQSILSVKEELLLGDAYKRQCLMDMDLEQLIDTILINPTVTLEQSDRNTPVTASSYKLNPLGNLVFTRDQMITTNRGIVLGSMGCVQRQQEVQVIEFALRKLGVRIVGRIPPSQGMTLEGGDFIGYNSDLCFIGTGIRTTQSAIDYLMEHDLFGTRRVAVVRDLFDRQQARMHLDCVFNIAHDGVAVLMESAIGKHAVKRRLVNEYIRQPDHSYLLTRTDVEFSQYLAENDFHVIPINDEFQEGYGINFINLGAGRLVCIHQPTANLIASDPVFRKLGGTTQYIDFSGVTAMFGGAHCATQVFRTQLRYTPPVSAGHPPVAFLEAPKPHTRLETNHCTSHVVMIVPTTFGFNCETSIDNNLMESCQQLSSHDIRLLALHEFARLHAALVDAGVVVHLLKHDSAKASPDAIFCPDWFSTHTGEDGLSMMVLYPLRALSRRGEREHKIVSMLKSNYDVMLDLTGYETAEPPAFLEGTASLVLDRKNKIAYATLSNRTFEKPAQTWAKLIGYRLVTFTSTNARNQRVLHTNTLLTICNHFVVVCTDAIDEPYREAVLESLTSSGRTIITISKDQLPSFSACMIELRGSVTPDAPNGIPILVLSTRAYEALTQEQKDQIVAASPKAQIVAVDFDFIERIGGGSIPAVIATLF